MDEKKANRYIDLVAELYCVGEKDLNKMRSGTDMIERAFEDYYWTDVEQAIDWYYVHKSDKTRPTIANIRAILSTWLMEKKIAKVLTMDEVGGYVLPTTKIFSINNSFDKLIQILVDCGLIPNENNEIQSTHSLINSDGKPILNAMQWLRWQLSDAMELCPDLFVKFPNASFYERLAIAMQNGLIKIRVRDWSTFAANANSKIQAAA